MPVGAVVHTITRMCVCTLRSNAARSFTCVLSDRQREDRSYETAPESGNAAIISAMREQRGASQAAVYFVQSVVQLIDGEPCS